MTPTIMPISGEFRAPFFDGLRDLLHGAVKGPGSFPEWILDLPLGPTPEQMDPPAQVGECALDPLEMQILHHQHQIMIVCQRLIELTRLVPPDVEAMLARDPDRLGMGGRSDQGSDSGRGHARDLPQFAVGQNRFGKRTATDVSAADHQHPKFAIDHCE
ncbi:MAG TPA: hypothetical protein PKE41_01810 [Candidatus Macondimonas sp.]|nr:hypothetical protein [Candidatus Macondimonas sp.]